MSTVRGFGAESIEKSVYDEHLLDFKAVNVRQALAYTGVESAHTGFQFPLHMSWGELDNANITVLRVQVIARFLLSCPILSPHWCSIMVASWCSCGPRS